MPDLPVSAGTMTSAQTRPTGLELPPPHVLREYALLADGERGILVGPRGEFVWMCFPRWDSPGVFSALLGGSGTYAITPRTAACGAATTSPAA